jgi:hypothetical protein
MILVLGPVRRWVAATSNSGQKADREDKSERNSMDFKYCFVFRL